MEELKDVVLNVYALATDGPEMGRAASFLTRFLPSLGMGAYHTSLELDGYNYTFAAGAGIVKSSVRNNNSLPLHASFQESIPLGSCRLRNRGQVATILKILGDHFFSPTSYHLVHRNCNHFTETLATALILHDELLSAFSTEENNDNNNNSKNRKNKPIQRLESFPDWINRLASTGGMMISHDDDIVPCQVWKEAAQAVGADTQVRKTANKNAAANTGAKPTSSTTKKTLTEAQKAALAKIRKK